MDKKVNTAKTVRQQEIVDAARKIISTQGIEKLTVRAIAQELKITDGALYRHFRSKKEIISLLIDDIEQTLLATIMDAAGKSDDPLKKLENILLTHLSYAEQRKGFTFIIINETMSIKDKSLQRKMFSVINKYLKMIEDILREGVKAGSFRYSMDFISAGVAFFGMIQSIVTLWALSGFKYSFNRRRITDILNVYSRGILIR